MSDPRKNLLDLAAKNGSSLSALSLMIGRNASYLQQFIRKGSPRRLEEQDRSHLADYFGVDESELGGVKEKSYTPMRRVPLEGGWVEIPRLTEADIQERQEQGAGDRGTTEYKGSPQDGSAGEGGAGEGGAGQGKARGKALGKAQAKTRGKLAAQPVDHFRFSRRWLREQGLVDADLFSMLIQGDAMEPLLRSGDEVLVDMAKQAFRDGVYLVRLEGNMLVKRIASRGGGRFSLLSQNLAYPPIEVSAGDMVILGRVVWKSGRI